MEIRQSREGGKLTFALDGQLDANSSKEFEKVLTEETKGVTELVLDMEKLTFITSAGLRVLAIAQKMMARQGHMILRNVQSDVREVCDMTGISRFLTIE